VAHLPALILKAAHLSGATDRGAHPQSDRIPTIRGHLPARQGLEGQSDPGLRPAVRNFNL